MVAEKINNRFYSKNEIFNQAAKYIVVGGLCTLLDSGFLFVFTYYMKIDYLKSSIFSFSFGTILNYYLCTYWIFSLRIIKKRHYEFFYYLIISSIGLVINTILMWSFTTYFGLYFMISKLIAVSVTFWWNFGARKYFLHTLK